MLRFQGLFSTGIGLLVVAPIAAPRLLAPAQAQRPDRAELEARLERTRQDLAQLAELRPGVLAGDPAAIQALLELSEPGPLDSGDGSTVLQALRLDIAAKEQRLARLQQDRPVPTEPAPAEVAEAQPEPPLAIPGRPGTGAATPPEPSLGERAEAAPAPAALTPETAFRRARSAYLAGDHLAALDRFRSLEGTPEIRYWTARCLERLGRVDEALEIYTAVAADPEAGDIAATATEGAEFLRWKADLERSAKELVERTRRPGGSR